VRVRSRNFPKEVRKKFMKVYFSNFFFIGLLSSAAVGLNIRTALRSSSLPLTSSSLLSLIRITTTAQRAVEYICRASGGRVIKNGIYDRFYDFQSCKTNLSLAAAAVRSPSFHVDRVSKPSVVLVGVARMKI